MAPRALRPATSSGSDRLTCPAPASPGAGFAPDSRRRTSELRFPHPALRTPHSALRTSHSARRTSHSRTSHALRTPNLERTSHVALRTSHFELRHQSIFFAVSVTFPLLTLRRNATSLRAAAQFRDLRFHHRGKPFERHRRLARVLTRTRQPRVELLQPIGIPGDVGNTGDLGAGRRSRTNERRRRWRSGDDGNGRRVDRRRRFRHWHGSDGILNR